MSQTKAKTFIIDDEDFVIQYIEFILQKNEFEVIGSASNGEDAIVKLQTVNPDLIICDITMPGMTGDELVPQLKALHPKSVVIMLSSRNTAEIVKKCKKGGADGYILKTGGEEEISNKVNKIWAEKSVGQERDAM